MTYRGIDYGLGQANVDKETGIRYGVIPVSAMDDEYGNRWFDDSHGDYGDASCPRCGKEVQSIDDAIGVDMSTFEDAERADYVCVECRCGFLSEECFPDEPNGYYIDQEGIKAETMDGVDVFVIKSPFFTRAAFCSPCAPGACYLMSPCEDGERAYCFGHDWFEDGKAPYPVYSVETGERVWPAS